MSAKQDTLIHIHIRLNKIGFTVEEIRAYDKPLRDNLNTAQLRELMKNLDHEKDTRATAEIKLDSALGYF